MHDIRLEASPGDRCVCAILAARVLKVVSQVPCPSTQRTTHREDREISTLVGHEKTESLDKQRSLSEVV